MVGRYYYESSHKTKENVQNEDKTHNARQILVKNNVTTKIFHNQTSWKIFSKGPFFDYNSELDLSILKYFISSICHAMNS